MGCCKSSINYSTLQPWVRVPSTPSILLSFVLKFVLYLSLHCEKNKNKQKETRFSTFKKAKENGEKDNIPSSEMFSLLFFSVLNYICVILYR